MSEKPDPSTPADATVSLGDSDVTRTVGDDAAASVPGSGAGGAADVETVATREFGTVRVKREIGRGAMGVVYLGHDRVLGRDVALKALVNLSGVSGAATQDASPAFLREARAAAAVKHPNLTQIHHADVAPDGTPYLVMEYVEGPSLAQLLRQSGPMKPAVVVSVLSDVCAAVEELHERDVVHRDLKPSNVLVNFGGDVFVTDFGLAVKRSAGQAGPARGDALVAGTPLYMAPEMFEGQVSPRSDIYAIGVMAFEMLCGHVPFSGSLDEVRRRHAEESLPSDELRAKGVPEELIDLIERATHKKAMFRYKTARELSRAVQQLSGTIDGNASAKFDLRRLIIRQGDAATPSDPPLSISSPAPAGNSTSYMETLSHIAAAKREKRMRLLEPPGEAAAAAAAAPAPPADHPLEIDIACVQCGYNLRSLAVGGQCPECGRAVRDSISPDRLVFADEQWLRVVTAGVATIAWGVVAVTLLFVFLQPIVFLVTSIVGRGSGVQTGLLTANFLLAPLIAAVFLAGIFAVTVTEPRVPSEAQPTYLRWIVRSAAIIACALSALTALPKAPHVFAYLAGRLTLEVSAFVAMGGTMLYMAWLAARVPDVKLAPQLRRRGWVLLYAGLGLVVLELVRTRWPPASLPMHVGLLTGLLVLSLVALSVAMLWLTGRVRKVLRETLTKLVPSARVYVADGPRRS